jgi:DNA polymerase III delta subunit
VAKGPASRGQGRLQGILAPADFEEALAAGAPLPTLVAAAGGESLLRDQVCRAALAAALGSADSPDAVILHGPAKAGEPDAPSLAAVIEDVRTPSLFAAGGRKVVVVRRADLLVAEALDALRGLLAAPAAGTLLLLDLEASPGSRTASAKVREALDLLAAAAPVVSCDAPSAEPGRGGGASPLAAWIAGRARARGKRLPPEDTELLVARSGTNLAVLDAAVAAAALHAGAAERISPADLEAVAPRGPAEGTDRFVEALLGKDGAEALRVLEGIYREGAYAWGAKTPVRGEAPVTFLLLGQVRRTARDARVALASGGAGPLPPSLRFGCRDARRLLRASRPAGLAGLLADLTAFEADLKGGASGAERARFEALVLAYAGSP